MRLQVYYCLYQLLVIYQFWSCNYLENSENISSEKDGIVLRLFLLFPQRNIAQQDYLVCINLVIFPNKSHREIFPSVC